MIGGVKQDFLTRDLGRASTAQPSSKAKANESELFAQKLNADLGKKELNRTESTNKPGRELNTESKFSRNREGLRSDEREMAPENKSSEKNSKQSSESSQRKDQRQEQKQELTQAQTQAGQQSVIGSQQPQTLPSAESEVVPFAESHVPAEGSQLGLLPMAAQSANQSATQLKPTTPTQGSVELTGSAAGATVSLLESMKQGHIQERNQALLDFMQGMETEFGVSAEEVIQAFGQMSPQALMAPPQAVAKEFVANLDLKPGQEAGVEALYNDMVQSTSDALMGEKLAGLQDGVQLEVASQREVALKKMNVGLDGMNQKFFQPEVDPSKQDALKAQIAADTMEAKLNQLVKKDSSSQDSAVVVAAPAPLRESSSLGLGAASAAGVSALAGQGAQSSAMDFSSEGGFSGSNSEGSLTGAGETQEDVSLTEASGRDASLASRFDESLAMEGSLEGAETTGAFASVEGRPAAGAATATGGLTASSMMRANPTPEDEQANVQELMRQAQIVLRKGGGEMKMELRPEGMGSVNLRVNVEDGQVNVQMLTESDAAKRLLEKGLSELKESLTSHQLRVGTMKVELGTEIQKQMDQNPEFSREQARQFAGDFMGQFRDERNAFRQGFMESSGGRGYGRAQSRASVEPDRVMSSGRSGSGAKRLDLVA